MSREGHLGGDASRGRAMKGVLGAAQTWVWRLGDVLGPDRVLRRKTLHLRGLEVPSEGHGLDQSVCPRRPVLALRCYNDRTSGARRGRLSPAFPHRAFSPALRCASLPRRLRSGPSPRSLQPAHRVSPGGPGSESPAASSPDPPLGFQHLFRGPGDRGGSLT